MNGFGVKISGGGGGRGDQRLYIFSNSDCTFSTPSLLERTMTSCLFSIMNSHISLNHSVESERTKLENQTDSFCRSANLQRHQTDAFKRIRNTDWRIKRVRVNRGIEDKKREKKVFSSNEYLGSNLYHLILQIKDKLGAAIFDPLLLGDRIRQFFRNDSGSGFYL